ncbi:hypothetical protein LJ756_09200 [Arthrobacter sp. zg-Y411]|uniref:hypothetical protein n=1 Tax=Arthrobacter zhangbolii TaxID=2886936 RepID=UPI001D147371|nr:hypothetical protein [Arthrobacter zhangbolii]MCC3294799.1 hypothetical protein [Arthrobacter zhangbolii]
MSADQHAVLLAKRPKPQRRDVNHMLLIVVAFKLGQDWSPEQISQWLRRTYPEDASMRLSHEAIYHQRSGRTMRIPRTPG